MGNQPDPHPSHMAENLVASRTRIVVVVDNCPSDLHRRLTDVCRQRGSLVSLLTIEYDIQEDEPEATDVFRLEPSSDSLIQTLIARRYTGISHIDAATISRFSGGNARCALVIAATVGRNGTLASFSDEDLLRRLFYQGNAPDERLMRTAQVCSLVYSFEGEAFGGATAELPRLASLAGITPDEMFAQIAELKARDLVQQRNVWRAVLPHTIANNLAKYALKILPSQKIEAAFNTQRLRTSFARRLGYLHDSKEAVALVTSWLESKDFLPFPGGHNEAEWEILESLAPVAPSATLACLERIIGSDSQRVPLISWKHDRAARILSLITHAADFFERCTDVLITLAEAEYANEGRPRNPVLETFIRLFQIHYSGTHAKVAARTSIVERLLRSDNATKEAIGLRALEELLRTRNFHANGTFEFGARTRDFGFWPGDRDEIVCWFRAALQLVERFAQTDSRLGSRVRTVLARNFSGMWGVTGIEDELQQLALRLSIYKWQEGWIGVRKALAKQGSTMAPEKRKRLEAIEEALRPTDVVSRTRAVVLTEAWGPLDFADTESDDDEPVERYERANNLAEELGESVASDENAFQALLPHLVSGRGGRLGAFGKGLARPAGNRTARWNALVEALKCIPDGQRNYGTLCGFMAGLHSAEPRLCNGLLDTLVGDPALGLWLPIVQISVPIDDEGVRRLLRLLDNDSTTVDNFRYLAGGRYLDGLDPSKLRLLTDAIRKKPNGFAVASDLLSMRLHSASKEERENPELAAVGRDLLQHLTFAPADNMQDHRLTQVATLSLRGPAGRPTAIAICERMKSAIENNSIYHLNCDQFVRTVLTLQPAAALDTLLGDSADTAKTGYTVIQDVARYHDQTNPLDGISDDTLVDWCNENPDFRYPLMSELVSFGQSPANGSQKWSSIALRILHEAPDPKIVLANFVDRFSPNQWEGSLSEHLERNLPLLNELNDHLRTELGDLALTKRIELQGEIDRLRERERMRDRYGDESFE